MWLCCDQSTGAVIKVFSECCPMSTDRVVEIAGDGEKIANTVYAIFDLLQSVSCQSSCIVTTMYRPIGELKIIIKLQ